MMQDEATEFELADANHVRVLETNILHASDVIYWLDGSTGETAATMARLDRPLSVSFSTKPRALQYLNSVGKTAFWQQPTQPMVDGEATELQRTRPAVANVDVAGQVVDASGRFNPALFAVTLGSGAGHGVVLYPSPNGVRVPAGGAVQGCVRVEATQKPLSWAVLTLVVTLSVGETVTFRGQADAHGDFLITLSRLPPLPLSVPSYDAVLTIAGDAVASANQWVNAAELDEVEVESTTAATFANPIPLTIRPGEIKRINSFSKSYIAVQIV